MGAGFASLSEMKCKGDCLLQTFFLSLAKGQMLPWGPEGGGAVSAREQRQGPLGAG